MDVYTLDRSSVKQAPHKTCLHSCHERLICPVFVKILLFIQIQNIFFHRNLGILRIIQQDTVYMSFIITLTS